VLTVKGAAGATQSSAPMGLLLCDVCARSNTLQRRFDGPG
jgi:hypothetical protein